MIEMVIMGSCALIFTASGAYLILSKGALLDPQLAFKGKRKIIYIAGTLAVTGVLGFGSIYGTNTLILGGANGSKPTMTQSSNGSSSTSSSTSATASKTITASASTTGQTLVSTKSDLSVLLVKNGAKYTLTKSTLTKSSGDTSNTDNSEFYGINAAALVTKGTLNISNSTIKTSAKGANALFATGSTSTINANNVTIKTTGNSSRGLDATYGATINATKMNISTSGAHCAAVATDRGGGTVNVSNSILKTSGEGSPCIYSTGKISVTSSTGQATGSSAVVIEGKNSATLNSSTLTCNGIGRATGGIDNCGVMIYQSTSGDATTGTGTFTAKNSTITISPSSSVYKTSPMFFVTNTSAIINLNKTTLNYGSGTLLKATGNSEWGTSGSNGATVVLNATNQTLTGNIITDKISSVTLTLKNSTLTSTVNKANKAKSVNISIDASSSWNVTGTSYVTKLTLANNDTSLIKSNGHNVYYSKSANSWLNGKTVTLNGGGKLIPVD